MLLHPEDVNRKFALPRLQMVSFDIISDLGWNEPFNCVEKEQEHSWVSCTRNHEAFPPGQVLSLTMSTDQDDCHHRVRFSAQAGLP